MPKPGGIYSDPIIVHQFLSSVGDGTGVTNANLDFDAAPDIFFIQPAADEIMVIHAIVIHLLNSGAFPVGVYGSLAGALANGIDIQVTNANSVAHSLLPVPITANDDFMHMGPNSFNLVNFSGGVDAISASITPRIPIILDGSQEHKIEVPLSDDLDGLVDHHFIAHGFK